MIDEDEAYASVPRRLPPLGMLFQPRFLLHTVGKFVYVWCASRPLRIILPGLPALLIGIAIIGIAFSVRGALNAREFVDEYRVAYDQARKDNDERAQEIALNSLLAFEPDNLLYRFTLAELRIRQNRTANGIATMRSLAENDNYVPAHQWLIQQLLGSSSNPTPDNILQAIGHLKKILKQNAEHPFAVAQLGKLYLDIKQPSLAEPFLRQAAAFDPFSRMRLASCLMQIGRIDDGRIAATQAENELRGLVEDDAENSSARILWAKSLSLQGRHQEERAVLMQGLVLSDDDPNLIRALADMMVETAVRERRRGAADTNRYTELLIQALKIDPKYLATISRLAQVSLKPGQIDQSLISKTHDYLMSLAEEDPDNAEINLLLAWAQRMQGDDARAIETMQKVVQDRPELRLSLAQLYRLCEQPKLADREAKTAVEYLTAKRDEDPKNHVFSVQLAQATEFLGDAKGATEIIDAALQKNPHPRLAILAIRFRLAHFDKLSQSATVDRTQLLKLTDEILELDPASGAAVNCLASLMRTKDEVGEQAKDRLQQQLTNTSNNTFRIHSLFGALAEADGDFAKAQRHLVLANRLQPNDPVVCNNLAHVMANVDGGDLDKALELANHALSKLPNHPEILETRGEILVKMKRYSEALTDLEQCLGKSGDPRDVHRYLAAAYDGLNDPEMSARHEKLSH